MTLENTDISARYKDVVQLEKSGAGLPSHAGKEAALYDGSGAQIIGRTAVRHWLDPHPDAASFDETWEFSETGDMTQAQLEAAGWTFSECTGSVSGGTLWLSCVAAATNMPKAYLATSLAGDFDFMCSVIFPFAYAASLTTSIQYLGGFGIADSVSNVAHHGALYSASVNHSIRTLVSGTFVGGGGTGANKAGFFPDAIMRVSRVSGTVYISMSAAGAQAYITDDTSTNLSKSGIASVADSTTFNRVFLSPNPVNYDNDFTIGYRFLRRFQ